MKITELNLKNPNVEKEEENKQKEAPGSKQCSRSRH